MARKVIGYTFIVAAILGLIFSLAGIVMVWVVRTPLTANLVSTLDLIDTTLEATSSGLKIDQPSRRCFCSECDLYCVSTSTRRKPECRQFARVKSIMRYFPPKGTAGLVRSWVSGCSRLPVPPARMMPLLTFVFTDSSRPVFENPIL